MKTYEKILKEEGISSAINQILIDHNIVDFDGLACDEIAKLFIVDNRTNYIDWLTKRIKATELRMLEVTELNTKISKGGKLCAYKGLLHYIVEH